MSKILLIGYHFFSAHQTVAGHKPHPADEPRTWTSLKWFPRRTQSEGAESRCCRSPANVWIRTRVKLLSFHSVLSLQAFKVCEMAPPPGLWLWSWARSQAAEGDRPSVGRPESYKGRKHTHGQWALFTAWRSCKESKYSFFYRLALTANARTGHAWWSLSINFPQLINTAEICRHFTSWYGTFYIFL